MKQDQIVWDTSFTYGVAKLGDVLKLQVFDKRPVKGKPIKYFTLITGGNGTLEGAQGFTSPAEAQANAIELAVAELKSALTQEQIAWDTRFTYGVAKLGDVLKLQVFDKRPVKGKPIKYFTLITGGNGTLEGAQGFTSPAEAQANAIETARTLIQNVLVLASGVTQINADS